MRIFRNGLAFPCRINQKFTRNRIISECFPRNLYDCFPAFRLPEYGAFPDSVPFPGRAVGISRNALIKQAVKMRTGRINGKVPAGIFCGIEKKEIHAVIFPYGTVVLLHLIHKIFHLHFRGNESRIKR